MNKTHLISRHCVSTVPFTANAAVIVSTGNENNDASINNTSNILGVSYINPISSSGQTLMSTFSFAATTAGNDGGITAVRNFGIELVAIPEP